MEHKREVETAKTLNNWTISNQRLKTNIVKKREVILKFKILNSAIPV